jgi:hypothetical protein
MGVWVFDLSVRFSRAPLRRTLDAVKENALTTGEKNSFFLADETTQKVEVGYSMLL